MQVLIVDARSRTRREGLRQWLIEKGYATSSEVKCSDHTHFDVDPLTENIDSQSIAHATAHFDVIFIHDNVDVQTRLRMALDVWERGNKYVVGYSGTTANPWFQGAAREKRTFIQQQLAPEFTLEDLKIVSGLDRELSNIMARVQASLAVSAGVVTEPKPAEVTQNPDVQLEQSLDILYELLRKNIAPEELRAKSRELLPVDPWE